MDLYVVLGLQQGATESEIKRAYRRLARQCHPHINPGDREAERRFRQILDAYETLIDPERRSRHESGVGVAESYGRRSGFEGFDFSARSEDDSTTFGDLFAEVLTDRGSRVAPERGADLHQEVRLAFEETFVGTTRPITVTRHRACRACGGAGQTRKASAICSLCDGTGVVRAVRGHMVFSRGCSACGGSGHQRPAPCPPCGGSGQETCSEAVHVSVPAGISDGDRIRIEGAGNAGVRGGPTGDLYITAHVAPHPLFRREGDDVHITLPMAVHEAALGARIEVQAPDGTVRLRVPPGTQSGQRFRVRERGAASVRDGHRGDFVIEVRLMLPKLLDERSKELLREFGRINGENVREHLE